METKPSALTYLWMESHILNCDACYKRYRLIMEHAREQEGKKDG
jgi:hypothetical protein